MVCFRDYEITRGYKLWTAWGFRWLETPRAFITSPRTMCRLFQPSYQKDCLRDFRAKGFLHLWLEPNFWLVSPNSPMHHLNPNPHETPLVPWSFQANHASQFSLWLAGVQASASGIDQNSHLGPHHFHPNQNWYLSTRIPCPQNTAANLLRRLKHCNKLLQLVIWVGDLVPWQDPTIIAKVGSQDSESVVKKICQKNSAPPFLPPPKDPQKLQRRMPLIAKAKEQSSLDQLGTVTVSKSRSVLPASSSLFQVSGSAWTCTRHRNSSILGITWKRDPVARATNSVPPTSGPSHHSDWCARKYRKTLDVAGDPFVPWPPPWPPWPVSLLPRVAPKTGRASQSRFSWRNSVPLIVSFSGMAIRASRMWTSSGWQGQTLGSHGFTTSGWMPTNIDIDHMAVPSKCTMGCKQSTVGAWV